MESNPFVLAPESYKRDLDIQKHYVHDVATYLSRMRNTSYEEARAFVTKSLSAGGAHAFKDPKIKFLERNEVGDREQREGTLSEYLSSAIKNAQLIAPTLTTYWTPKHVESLLVSYIDANVKARGVAKKAKFAAKMAGNKTLELIKDNEQNNKKLANNAISGAHCTPSTPLFNKTSHSTLTSNCRTTSGFGNANNEKFLNGNRHYWSPDITRNNIISIINHTDYEKLDRVIQKYGIRHPTIEETVECIRYSTDLYWRHRDSMESIVELVHKLTDIERSAFVYTGDLYHLMKHNEALVRGYITAVSARITTPLAEPEKVISYTYNEVLKQHEGRCHEPEENLHLAAQICSEEMKGKKLEDIYGTEAYQILAATTLNIRMVTEQYADLIDAFWVTENVPASLAWFPDSIRRAALTSDTDSTIFTVQDWVEWHHGKIAFDQPANATAATMIWLAAQTITHVLARMSANFGIETKRIHQVAMKNEYKFDVFVPTQVAKHYFALIGCQEGNLFKEYEKEIKGVHLRSSNAPRVVIQAANQLMEDIMNTIVAGRKIKIKEILTRVADIERDIFSSLVNGSSQYFRKGQIQPPESYTKGPTESNYVHYSLWNDIFGPKYGTTPPPPYRCIRIGTDMKSPAKTKAWLDSLEDQELAERARNWMKKTGKSYFGSFWVPEQIVQSSGIPKEILEQIGSRKLVADGCKTLYLILEALGVYMGNSKLTRLCSDHY